uniref:Bifunctional phosphoribosylaminoimidazole carboxylase/phosphoribosylaminoimidazole succinocarboxamide synthetase n=1 Tax=Equus caballus TaxID=9796 RepID=A0A9L0S927_HORSE
MHPNTPHSSRIPNSSSSILPPIARGRTCRRKRDLSTKQQRLPRPENPRSSSPQELPPSRRLDPRYCGGASFPQVSVISSPPFPVTLSRPSPGAPMREDRGRESAVEGRSHDWVGVELVFYQSPTGTSFSARGNLSYFPAPKAGVSPASLPCAAAAPSPLRIMATAEVLNIGKKLYEGKTKEVYELLDSPGKVLLQSKDQITAGNAARKNHLEGKAAISNKITSCIFQLLQEAGIKTAFTRKCGETAFIAPKCEMIPIEWVCRRIATGSFLKRNPGVKEGYKFYPPKVEMFFKDDANNDPQWSQEQLIAAKFCFAGLAIGQTEVDIMSHATQAIFEILEKSWLPLNCTLVDMKIEFGVDVTTKEIVLADVIDNDSWRLWPSGDRSQQKDKQSYRDLKEVTPEGLQMVKKNFEWVAERVELLLRPESQCRVVVLMGSTSDLGHCEKIKKACGNFGIPCELRVTSAHKGPDETLRIKAEYEGDSIPTVFVAVAGRSNGLGPVMSANTAYPVISCPPLTPDWGAQDVWSSLRLPSGVGCSTVLSPEGSAQFAAQIFGLNNHLVWAKLRASILNTWISLKQSDKKIREGNL